AHDHPSVTESSQLDALVALERIGTRLSFGRNDAIYSEGDEAECWYKVISGTVRICKLLADGRRHIAEFCFSGDCFGIDNASERIYAAEAIDDVTSCVFGAGPPSRWLIRLGVYSRCGLHTRAVTNFVTAIRGLQTFRHLHACPGCFRLERSPGGA